MKILNSMHVIAVPSLAASSAFYRDVFGFEIREIGDPGWRMFVRDACRIMAGECANAMPPRDTGDHSYFMYVTVDDVSAFFEQAVAHGADVTKQPRDEAWGAREFGIRTVDGHRIMIGQRLG